MANQLQIRKVQLPDDWDDDIRMNFLFSEFRERSVNPEGWDAKMRFWVNLIQELSLKCDSPVINHSSLCTAFERKGKLPQCLDTVLENMFNQGLVTSFSNFAKVEPEKGWIGWGFDMFVQKPVSWGFSTVQSMLKWSKKEDHYIVISVVKELASKLLQRHSELVNSELTDNVLFLEAFQAQCKDICTGTNFNLALAQLQKDRQVYILEDNGKKVLKFRSKDEKTIKPLSEVDKGVLNLQNARNSVLEHMDSIEEDIRSCDKETRMYVKAGNQTKAMIFLKKKKRLELLLKKKSVELDNIENLLCQLQNSGSEKMVLEAYKAGAQAIKATVKDDLNLDRIDTTMAEVEGMFDDYAEVQRTLSKPVTPGGDSLEDFEDELNELLALDKPSPAPKQKERSPGKVTDEDLLNRLAALRSPPEGVPPVKKPAKNILSAR